MAKFLLADDHIIIRTGLKFIIENFMPGSIIDEAEDGDSAFEKIKQRHYDLAVLDISMPNTDSFMLVSNILALKKDMKIIVFSMSNEAVYAQRFLKMGVMGYLQKDEDPGEIKRAITLVLNNKKYVSPRLSQLLIGTLSSKKTENPFDRLSGREIEIVQYLVRGESLVDISKKLALHRSTLSTHKARIFQKLGCFNIIDLNMLAKAHNIISPQ